MNDNQEIERQELEIRGKAYNLFLVQVCDSRIHVADADPWCILGIFDSLATAVAAGIYAIQARSDGESLVQGFQANYPYDELAPGERTLWSSKDGFYR